MCKFLQRWNIEIKTPSKTEYSMEYNDRHSVASTEGIMA